MTIIHPLLASRSAPNYRQSWRLAGVWRRAINLMTESGELLTLHRQGVVSAPADGCFAARNSMRYAVDYAAMNDHRLWHKVFVSGVSRLNSHSVIVCYVLRRLRILNRLPLHGCNARRRLGLFGPLALAASDPLPAELRQFRHCFQAALNGVKTDWRHWLGKGPGLTPSHDDTLSGMLLAAWYYGALDARSGRPFLPVPTIFNSLPLR